MRGQATGVHVSILNIDTIAFCTPCGRNLAATVSTKSSSKAMPLFEIMQRIYTIFKASPKRKHRLVRRDLL